MFSNGNLLHFEDYEFDNGGSKNKYMVVLYNVDGVSIVASLTSSQDYIPDSAKTDGCIHDDDKGLHCYMIPTGLCIGSNDYSFKKDTYIYVHMNIRDKKIEDLVNNYQAKGKLKKKCTLNPDTYRALLQCIVKGKFVAKKVKLLLNKRLSEIDS